MLYLNVFTFQNIALVFQLIHLLAFVVKTEEQYIWLFQQFSVLHFNAIVFSCSLVCYISVHLDFAAVYCATFQSNWLFLQFYTFQCICRIVHLTRSPLTVTRCEQSTPLSCNNSILVETFYKNSEKAKQ